MPRFEIPDAGPRPVPTPQRPGAAAVLADRAARDAGALNDPAALRRAPDSADARFDKVFDLDRKTVDDAVAADVTQAEAPDGACVAPCLPSPLLAAIVAASAETTSVSPAASEGRAAEGRPSMSSPPTTGVGFLGVGSSAVGTTVPAAAPEETGSVGMRGAAKALAVTDDQAFASPPASRGVDAAATLAASGRPSMAEPTRAASFGATEQVSTGRLPAPGGDSPGAAAQIAVDQSSRAVAEPPRIAVLPGDRAAGGHVASADAARDDLPSAGASASAATPMAFASTLSTAVVATPSIDPHAAPAAPGIVGTQLRLGGEAAQRAGRDGASADFPRSPSVPGATSASSFAAAPPPSAAVAASRAFAQSGARLEWSEGRVDPVGGAQSRDAAIVGLGGASPPLATGPAGGATPTPAAALGAPGAPVARQVAEHALRFARRPGDGEVEIRLDPPELGRVRLSLTRHDHGLAALVIAERPEVADLLRRHADLLGQSLAEAGHARVDLQFGREGQGGGQGPARFGSAPDGEPTASASSALAATSPAGGLDLRM